jgi:hypothetical protein
MLIALEPDHGICVNCRPGKKSTWINQVNDVYLYNQRERDQSKVQADIETCEAFHTSFYGYV